MKALFWSLLLVASLLAGCTGSDDNGDAGDGGAGDPGGAGGQNGTVDDPTGGSGDGQDGDDQDGGGEDGGNGTVDQGEAEVTSFEADSTSGEAPLNVTFSLDGSGAEDATWRIAFGDGADQEGAVADLPTNVTHTYSIGGNFTASATIGSGDASARSANLTIQVTVPEGTEAPQLVFEYAEALGCSWDVTGQPCITESQGPDAPAIDGFWQPLDDRYWGMAFSSTVTRGGQTGSDGASWPLFDTDCFFYGDDAATRIGNGNNGGAACGSAEGVPEGAMWLFITPYAAPAESMTLTFGVPPAAE